MWSAYIDTSAARAFATRRLGTLSRRAYYGPLAPLRTRAIREGELTTGRWVHVRNVVAGIAADDLARIHLERNQHTALAALPRPPREYLGREVVGVVSDIGPQTELFRIGDRVVYQLDRCCATLGLDQQCAACSTGDASQCLYRFGSESPAIGGGWSDEMVVHEAQLFLVPDSLTHEQAALMEPCARAVHAVLRHQPQVGERALVIGSGTDGLLIVQALQSLAPRTTVAVLLTHSFEAEMAGRIGAAQVLAPGAPTSEAARITGATLHTRHGAELLVAGGFDVVYDTVGDTQSITTATRWLRDRGDLILTAAVPRRLHVDLTPIFEKSLLLLGTRAHSMERWPGAATRLLSGEGGGRISSFALAATLLREHHLTPEWLVTHRFPLREVRRAVATARDAAQHHVIKVLLDVQEPHLDAGIASPSPVSASAGS